MNYNGITFLIFLILISINLSISSFCGTDDLGINPLYIKEIKNNNTKRKTDSSYTPIKIKIDYTSLERDSLVSSETLEKIKENIDATVLEYEKFLKVQHSQFNLYISDENFKKHCPTNIIDPSWRSFYDDYDLIIFPRFNSSFSQNILASAAACLFDEGNHRPLAGIISLNPQAEINKRNIDLYMKRIFFHEFTHILIFHPTLLNKLGFITNINSISYINSPKVVEKAKQHFNCEDINGIPLENQGASASRGMHWESRYMLGDYMISTDYLDFTISDITLALFEDSGFYQVDYYSGGLFKFGKNKGCKFFREKCIVNEKTEFSDEFCTNYNQETCSNAKINKAECELNNYAEIPNDMQYFSNPYQGGFIEADYCPVATIHYELTISDYFTNNCKVGQTSSSNYGEKIGDNSFCFVSSLVPSSYSSSNSKAICYEVECDKINKKIKVKIGSSTVTCPTSGGILNNPSGLKGSIECPKYVQICDFESNNMCNDPFDCLSKQSKTDPDSYGDSYDYFDDNDNDGDDDDEGNDSNGNNSYPIKIRRSSSENLKYNCIILFLLIFLFA